MALPRALQAHGSSSVPAQFSEQEQRLGGSSVDNNSPVSWGQRSHSPGLVREGRNLCYSWKSFCYSLCSLLILCSDGLSAVFLTGLVRDSDLGIDFGSIHFRILPSLKAWGDACSQRGLFMNPLSDFPQCWAGKARVWVRNSASGPV